MVPHHHPSQFVVGENKNIGAITLSLERDKQATDGGVSGLSKIMATNQPAEQVQVIISLVPGLSNELAALLINAIKTRRKYLSRSFSSAADQDKLISLEESAIDACTAFLGGLRKQVEAFKSRYDNSTNAASKNSKQSQNAATFSLEFLLSTLAETENSFHLRRAALILCKEILIRSSDARAFLARESILMDFVSTIRQADQQDGSNSVAKIFQQEAIDLIVHLANKYGQLYPKFVVAERLFAEISTVSSAPHISTSRGSNGAAMKSLRAERDAALQKGDRACDVLQRILDRADGYFAILVPRFGGFANSEEAGAIVDGHEVNAASEDDDDIDWEEGDDHVSDSENPEHEHTLKADPAENENDAAIPGPTTDHQTAVAQTLAVMQRSGVIQEGELSVEVDSTQITTASDTDSIHQKLKDLLHDLTTRRMPRLNRWIHALSHADGMEERVAADPASGSAGPVSLVLLSEERRTARGPLLKRMMKVKGEIDLVLQSAGAIGVLSEEHLVESAALNNNSEEISGSAKKRTWLSSVVVAGKPFASAAKKKTKSTKFKVIYRKK
jgi:hypothetical protein